MLGFGRSSALSTAAAAFSNLPFQMLPLLGLLWASGTPEHWGEIKVPCVGLASTQRGFTVLEQCV